MKTIAAKEARTNLPSLLSEAEKGRSVLIVRNSKPAAALMPPEFAELAPIIRSVLEDLGESLAISKDEQIIALFEKAQADIEAGRISFIEVD